MDFEVRLFLSAVFLFEVNSLLMKQLVDFACPHLSQNIRSSESQHTE